MDKDYENESKTYTLYLYHMGQREHKRGKSWPNVTFDLKENDAMDG